MKTKVMIETNMDKEEVEVMDEMEVTVVDEVGITITTTRKGKAQQKAMEEAIQT